MQLSAQSYCIDGRFDNYAFDSLEIETITNIQYGEALNYQGELEPLGLDIYMPPVYDVLVKKPLVLFIHGGGLVGGDKATGGGIPLGYDMAKKGFVCASINYRLGYNDLGECNGDTSSLQLALYRALQDTRAAIRFLKEGADSYGIDTNFIFLIGSSVGSTIALNTAFATQENFMQYQYDLLGSIDSSTNTFYNHTIAIHGVIGRAAGVQNTEIFSNAVIPVQFFHGTCDNVVPYIEGPLYNCFNPVRYMQYYGSWEMARIMRANGNPYQLYTNEGYDHSAVETDTAYLYAGLFLKDILCNTLAIPGTEYYRYNNGGCIATSKEDFSIGFSPNPFQNELLLTVKGAEQQNLTVELFTYTGQQVMAEEYLFLPPLLHINLNLKNTPTSNGIYFLRVRSDTIEKSVPLIRQF